MTAADKNSVLKQVGDLLYRDDDIVLAIAFGSLATDDMRPDSDMDIAVLTRKPLTRQRRESLIRSLACISGRAIDLVDLDNAGVVLLRSILRNGKRLVCKSPRAPGDLVFRMIMDGADFLPYRQRLLEERRKAWIH